ncbi:hypothetical protein D3C76_1446820 [compost metagenome]
MGHEDSVDFLQRRFTELMQRERCGNSTVDQQSEIIGIDKPVIIVVFLGKGTARTKHLET